MHTVTALRPDLYSKYNVPGPRYTSYPTVPCWDEATFTPAAWQDSVRTAFLHGNEAEGISLYLHLPFCESLCTFCGCTKRITRNHGVEQPYADAVLAEWALYRALMPRPPRVRELHLGGGTPTFFSPGRLAALVATLLEVAEVATDAELSFEAHPNNTTDEHLEALAALGFTRLSLGVQDFDPVVQQAIHRVQSFERVAEVTAAARARGYTSINFDLVYGLPKQRLEGIEETVQRVLALRPERIAFYAYAHVPWIRGLGQRGFSEQDLPQAGDKRALYEAGRHLLQQAGYREIGMDHFALPEDALSHALEQGRLHRNFMGYTPAHTRLLLGLGMSAIGETGVAFAQNEKTVEDYQARVAEGRLPLLRGHLLDAEDRRLRRHILDLMCRFRTAWPEDTMLAAEARARLAEMQADGLVQLSEAGIRVTSEGHAFLRNICMALDARLWRRQPQSQLFSSTL